MQTEGLVRAILTTHRTGYIGDKLTRSASFREALSEVLVCCHCAIHVDQLWRSKSSRGPNPLRPAVAAQNLGSMHGHNPCV